MTQRVMRWKKACPALSLDSAGVVVEKRGKDLVIKDWKK